MEKTVYDCVVIGGGISGISFAHNLHKAGKSTLILEKKSKAGGQIQSIYSDYNSSYWRELGSHTCYNSYIHLLSILKDIESTDIIQPLGKGSYVVYSDRKIKKMFAEISVLPLIFNGIRMFFTSKKGKTVKDYFSRVVGRSNYNNLFSYLFRAVICQNADDYPAELFLKHRKDRYKEFPRKFTFKGGISSFLNEIIKKDNLNVETDREVISIEIIKDRNHSYYKISTVEKSYLAQSVAFATDPRTSSELLSKMEPEVAAMLSSIPLFRTESLNVVVAKEKLSIELVSGVISLTDDFHSAVSRDLVDNPHLRSFTFHFEEGIKSKDEKFSIICDILSIKKEDILDSTSMSHVLPSVRTEHLGLADEIDKHRNLDNIYILGNYFYGLSIEDCIHRSSDEFIRFGQKND